MTFWNVYDNMSAVCEAQGKGRAKGDLGRSLKGQKSQRSRIKLLMDQVR